VLSLICGAHGTEYASIVAMHKLARSVDPVTLSGTMVILPLLNQASFAQMVPHLNPVDGKSLNRLYPGKPDGTQSERISWKVTKQVLERSDYVIVPIGNSELNENMEFGYPPSSLLPGAQRTSFVDCRHGDDLQISNRPPGGKHRSAPSTRGAPSLGEAA